MLAKRFAREKSQRTSARVPPGGPKALRPLPFRAISQSTPNLERLLYDPALFSS